MTFSELERLQLPLVEKALGRIWPEEGYPG